MSLFDFKDADQFKEKCGYTIDGLWYPRVTKILEIKSKPALYYYYGEAKSYKAAQEATELSAKEGTLVHETIQKLLIGEHPPIDQSIRPAVEAAMKFVEEHGIQFDAAYIEKRICNKDSRYAGTIDAIALINGQLGVLDIKTSQAIYRDYNLQTSAYMAALVPEIKNLNTRWIFRIDQNKTCFRCNATLRPKGGREKIRRGNHVLCHENDHDWGPLTGVPELKEMPFWKADFEAFLGAKKLWEWENENWLKKIRYC